MKATNIKWETDGEDVDLPSTVKLPQGIADCTCNDPYCDLNTDSINNYLSDTFGWLVQNYQLEK